ncbi:MAG: NTP transferase domain-containing protein [Firmicutes bacterium]|nr:NTP transferase domain-containing protein [Bacillota bacterium]
MNSITLVVMAAGMGSRFGGLKQLEPIGPNGQALLDFSVADAARAGFDRAIFVIRRENEQDFRNFIGDRLSRIIKVDYVYQETESLPAGRTKPWGPGHAILCCKDAVDGPFAVINADDFYGPEAFRQIAGHLATAEGGDFAMVGFDLMSTISDNGTVSRGVCEIENGRLVGLTERTKVCAKGYTEDGEHWIPLPEDTVVSMNFWGFTPKLFEALEADFEQFMRRDDLDKAEFQLPTSVSGMLHRGEATVKMLRSHDKWYGMTYREDIEQVKAAVKSMCEQGLY